MNHGARSGLNLPNMNQTNLRRLRTAMAFALTTATALAQTAPKPAATAAPSDDLIQLAVVNVTGSNIKRLDVEKVLPVSVISAAEMEIRDASQPSDLLTALPQVTGLPGNETATLGATARGDNATISLRGIPSGNTLVLLNGRRLVPHPISQGEAGVPTSLMRSRCHPRDAACWSSSCARIREAAADQA